MDDTLWNHVEGAKSKRPDTDAPTQQPMRAGIKPADRKAPTADQKRVRRQMAKSASSTCAVPGDNHSDDLVETYHGSAEPTLLCGFHAQDVNESLKKIRSTASGEDLRAGDLQPGDRVVIPGTDRAATLDTVAPFEAATEGGGYSVSGEILPATKHRFVNISGRFDDGSSLTNWPYEVGMPFKRASRDTPRTAKIKSTAAAPGGTEVDLVAFLKMLPSRDGTRIDSERPLGFSGDSEDANTMMTGLEMAGYVERVYVGYSMAHDDHWAFTPEGKAARGRTASSSDDDHQCEVDPETGECKDCGTPMDTPKKESSMTQQHTEASLLQAMASAKTMTEQSHFGELLQGLREARRDQIAQDGGLDWGSMGSIDIRPTFTPVQTTAQIGATAGGLDWLDTVVPDRHDDRTVTAAMRAEATLWYEDTVYAPVKRDPQEFRVQATNAARRTASRFGHQANGAASMFLETVQHLHRKAGFKTAEWATDQFGQPDEKTQDGPFSQENGSKLPNPSDEQTFDGLQTDLSGASQDPKSKPADSASMKEGDQPEGDVDQDGTTPPIKDTNRGTYDKSTRGEFVDSLPSGGSGNAATGSRRQASWSKGDRVERDGKTYEVTNVGTPGAAGTRESDGPKYTLKLVVDGEVQPAGQGPSLDVWSGSMSNPTSAFTKASAKSDSCPKCSSKINPTVTGNKMTAKCGSCGWSGSKTKESSRRTADGPTNTFPCKDCGKTVERWKGEYDVNCHSCGAPHNASGQRLRDDYASNPSMYDDEIGDMEGYEMQHHHDASRTSLNIFESIRRALATDDPKISPSDSPSLQEGDQPEGDTSQPQVAPAAQYPSNGNLDASTWGGNPDNLNTGGTGNAATSGPMPGTPQAGKAGSRRTAVNVSKVKIKDRNDNTFTGTKDDGSQVTFRLSDSDAKDVRNVMFGDLGMNFSGLEIEESDIVKAGSRRTAATYTCVHCDRTISYVGGRWIDPEATGDDSVWRETCDSHDTFAAEHEPAADWHEGSRTASEYKGGSPKDGDTATCHKGDGNIEFFAGEWMHLKGGGSHNDVYPATPREKAEKEARRRRTAGEVPEAFKKNWDKDGDSGDDEDDDSGKPWLNEDGSKKESSLRSLGARIARNAQTSNVQIFGQTIASMRSLSESREGFTGRELARMIVASGDVSDQDARALRYLASEEGGMTCSVCGDKIAKDPSGEDPSTYHHDNGEKHDHEAKPGGSKESASDYIQQAVNRGMMIGRSEHINPGAMLPSSVYVVMEPGPNGARPTDKKTSDRAEANVWAKELLARTDWSPYDRTASRKTATYYCTSCDVFVGDGNRDTHSGDDHNVEQRKSKENKEGRRTPFVREAGGRGNDFSISDAQNEEGEWIMSPEQIRSEMAYSDEEDPEDFYDDDDFGMGSPKHSTRRTAETITVDTGVCSTCGWAIVGRSGQWMHDTRKTAPVHPDGSVAGDAHGITPVDGSQGTETISR